MSLKNLILILSLLTACTRQQEPTVPVELTPEQLVQRGRSIYVASCVACHHTDPSKDGSVGPSLAGSSLELLQKKVLKNQYPEGYTPKKSTGVMVALPHLEKEIPALHAYLNSLK